MGNTFDRDNTISYVERSLVSLKENYTFANASESFYRYIGSNSVRPFPALLHEDDRDSFLNAVGMLHIGKESIVVRIMNHAGEYRQFHIVMSLNGKIIKGFESIDMIVTDLSPLGESMTVSRDATNIVDLMKSKGEDRYYLREEALDAVSSVYGRKAMKELVKDIFDNRDEEYPIYLVMIDIDEFKAWNDTYGHAVGDQMIEIVGATIKRVIGKRGYVGRFGGDEFIVVLNKIKTDDEIILMFKTIRNNIAWECSSLGYEMPLTLSLGLSSCPKDGNTGDELMKISDKCLYIAKARGRNRFIRYDKSRHESFDIKNSRMATSEVINSNYYLMCVAARDFLASVRCEGESSVEKAMDRLRKQYDIDGISIFTGPDYERVFTSGNYVNPLMNMKFINIPSMKGLFDGNGVFSTNNSMSLKETCVEAYDVLHKQGIEGIIMVRFLDDDKQVLITFDIFNRKRKWSDVDKGLALIVANEIYYAQKRNFK